ncbi:MAG TPA: arginase, partial [Gemmatimonadales bacterium]|nr:arginase [Gemmatimonadales bacterium]
PEQQHHREGNRDEHTMIVHVLGVPMDLGSGRRGVDMGPSAIRIAGLEERLRELGHTVVDEGDLGIKNIEELKVGDVHARFLGEIARASRQVATKVTRIVERGEFPLVLGGDHSISAGTVSGIAAAARAEKRKVGLLWIDAHGDINTPETSPSGNIHGMPVAALLGEGPPELTGIAFDGPKVDPANVALVGIRSLDDGEKKRLKWFGVQVHTMSDVDRHGIHRVMRKALARVTEGTDYVHVSFDLDAVDPTVAPGVGTPVKGGLDYREAHLIMELLHDSGVMTSLEIVEVNPILDDRNSSALFAVELVQSAFGKKIL